MKVASLVLLVMMVLTLEMDLMMQLLLLSFQALNEMTVGVKPIPRAVSSEERIGVEEEESMSSSSQLSLL